MKDLLEDFLVFIVTAIIFVGGFLLVVFFVICMLSIESHGSGEMDAYITEVSRVGDRVFVTAKDSIESSNKYQGCVSIADEQQFKDAIGQRVRLKWDGVFSFSPIWMECPAPLKIVEYYTGSTGSYGTIRLLKKCDDNAVLCIGGANAE